MWFNLPKQVTDDAIIKGIQQAYPQRQAWENKLYLKFRYLIKEAIWKHRLQEDEASIAYSDTILAVIRQINTGAFAQKSSLKTYVYRIYQNKCLDCLRTLHAGKRGADLQDGLEHYLELLPDEHQDTIRRLCAKYDVANLKRRIQLMDERCQRIILAWGEGYQDKEIAVEMGYQSPAVAKTSRLRCLEKLKQSYKTVKGLITTSDGRAD
ncbi:hypothetical protein GCM10023231_19990 [Olivibacter ginsenosidimutans]|uniref:Sigma-70 family RNA polymerase sigma factor n=1 Tax=Olivibacter ginsenosidimutans TaxID=1176537 RepID=A0ABP9B845_9SPHI